MESKKEEKKCRYCKDYNTCSKNNRNECQEPICQCGKGMEWSERRSIWFCKSCTVKRWEHIAGKIKKHGIYDPIEITDTDKERMFG